MTQPVETHLDELHDPTDPYDVIVVGYGPVGRMLALKLGGQGHRVLVVERQNLTYPLPRAVHMDDETCRILQSVGGGPDQIPESIEPYNDFYEWKSADGTPLLRLDWSGRGPSGWNVSNFFNQPLLEEHLNKQVEQLDTVTILRGWRAAEYAETPDAVTVSIATASGLQREVSGRYVVGADGANSIVRSWIGATMSDLGYFHDWLVVDLIPHTPMKVEPPAWQLCDPARPTTLVPAGPGRRRFEFMRLPDESVETLAETATTWQLLEPWGVTPDSAELERQAVYTFQAKWADAWKAGRLLIAGDSAHLMPPFAGQGMCSGLRDAVNLAWRLHHVLDGDAGDGLLESYSSERAEHVRAFIEASMSLGEIICVTDPTEAATRDVAMSAAVRSGDQPPPRPLPRLGAGFYRGTHPADGTLFIQAPVNGERGDGLFDDVTAGGATLLLRDTAIEVSPATLQSLSRLGVQVVALAGTAAPGAVVDSTGSYAAWFAEADAAAVLTRPDFYVFGVATGPGDVAALAEDYVDGIRRA